MKSLVNFAKGRSSNANQWLLAILRSIGVEAFAAGSLAPLPANDNSPPREPSPPLGAPPVPTNDNGAGSNPKCLAAKWSVVLAAGTIITAASLSYLPQSQKTHPRKPSCEAQNVSQTNSGPTRIRPDTPLSSLNEVQREQLIDAMQRQEGWRLGTTSYRGNNPGNLNQGRFARARGSIGDNHGIAIFPNYETGRKAMKELIFEVYGNRTILGMLAGDPTHHVAGYAPAVKDQFGNVGNPGLYAKHVTTWMNEVAAKQSDQSAIACSVGAPHRKHPARPTSLNIPHIMQPKSSARVPNSVSPEAKGSQHHGRTP